MGRLDLSGIFFAVLLIDLLCSMLQVLPKAERRGLGGLLAAAMTRRIAKSEQVTLTAWIVSTNFRSEALLTKIGYHKAVVNEWIKLLPA